MTQIGLKYNIWDVFLSVKNKVFLILVLSAFFLFTALEANSKVLIEGNSRISDKVLLSYIKTAKQGNISQEKITQITKKLYQTGLFAEVEVYSNKGDLIISVAENPIVTDVKIVGNDDIEDSALLDEISIKKRSVFTKSKLGSDLKRISDIYIKSGRYLADVSPKLIQKKGNRVELIFDIKEGPQSKISKITFLGNSEFSDSELKEKITTKESRWYKFFSSSDIYDSDRVEFDKEKLRRFYSSKGYADFATVSAVAQISKNKDDFHVNFLLEEGIKYKINDIQIDNRIENYNEEELYDLITIEKGDWYNYQQIENDIDEMVDLMSDRSYAFAQIDPILKRNKEDEVIDLTFLIRPSPRIYIDSIVIKGNTRTKNKVILQELKIRAGDPYNITRINRSKQRVRNLGFFDKVEIETKRIPGTDKVILEIEVSERKTGELNLGLGYSTVDRASINVGLRERNFMGTGNEVGGSVRKSKFGSSANISYTKSYFMDRPIRVGGDLFTQESDKRFSLAFDQKSRGGSVRAGYRISEYLGHNVNYSIREQSIENADPKSSLTIRSLEGKFVTSSIGQNFSYDKRDNLRDTREGYNISLGQEFAGVGGDIKYLKYTGSASYYQPIYNRNFVFKLLLHGGYIDGLGQDVRNNFGFYLGGNNFRGFEYAGLGPRTVVNNGSAVGGSSVGGNMYYMGTAEIRFPLGLPEDLGIYGILFSDNGTVKSVDSITSANDQIVDTGSLRSSYGLSIAWQSPLGPIRFDFSRISKREDFDRTENFRFSFGTRF